MIFVTSGHVDHGKTALLQALTGTNTAHLPEEKKRGLTIDLGYAYLPLDSGEVLGFIDVPGHQRFLGNMLAGLGGVQYAILMVAADEGVKPQTVEHFAILQLLQFEQIMLVITKADRATDEQIEQLILQIYAQFPPLAEQPCFITSAYTGRGIDELKQHLIALSQPSALIDKPFRYAIDRVFSVKGAGLVVTGTAVGGQVEIGSTLFLSDGQKVRVKGIHAQNTPAEIGLAGQRLALNLANVAKESIQRGDWLTHLAPDFATDRITVLLNPSVQLKENSVVHLYHFARHITAKLNLLTAKQAKPNEQLLAEVILDEPLHMATADRLILRSGDDSQTIAGAVVVEIHSPKRHKRSPERLDYLENLIKADSFEQKISLYLQQKAQSLAFLQWSEQCEKLPCGELIAEKWLVSREFKQQLSEKILTKLQAYHDEHQDQVGVTKARLYRIVALDQPESVVLALIDELIKQGQLQQDRGWVHLPEHQIALNAEEQALWAEIQPIFAATNQALWVRDIATQLHYDETAMRQLLYKIGKLGYLVPIVKDRFLLFEQISHFAQLIRDFIAKNGSISVNQLRDEIQYGRKLTVQLIEYFDRSGFLRRKGNVHLLRDGATY